MRILLVEDNPGDARLLRESFAQGETSFDVTHVERLSEALERLREPENFDVVLLDLSLPDSSGLETVRSVLDACGRIPIVVLTGLADYDLGVEALRNGAQDYLVKGEINHRALVKAILYACERKRMEKERQKLLDGLRRARDKLEQRVRDRTAELSAAVEKLQKEAAERQLAEQALREQSEIVEAFFKHSITPLVVLDRDFNFIRVNEAYARACGRDASEFPGRNHFDMYPSDAKTIFEQVVATRKPFQVFARAFGFPDHPEWGVTYWDWTLVPILDDSGEVEFLVFSLQDVTSRKRSEEEIRAASLYARSLIEASLDPLVTISPDGKITDVNKATELATGRARARLIGSDFSSCFTDPERAENGYERVLSEGSVKDYPLTLRHSSGSAIDVLYNATVYRDQRGRVQGVFAAARDVTLQKETERRSRFTLALLELFATKATRKEYLDSVVQMIHAWSGSRCIGIRILDGEGNIPYDSYLNFSRAFWELENCLSVKTDVCACVRVVLGAPEPQDLPALTPGGSFRTDNALKFVNSLTDWEKARFRGNCVKHGFLSLAVIPIRYQGKTLGAVHLADEREGVTSPAKVKFIESMTPLIGEAIHRFNVEEDLRRNYLALRDSQEQLKTANVALEWRTGQLRALAFEVIQTEQRERRRLAQLLHDHLQQLLAAAKIKLSALRKELPNDDLSRSLGQVVDLLTESIAATRSLAVELSPPVLYEAGLSGALNWLAAQMREKHSLAVEVRADPLAEPPDEKIRVLLFQAARELLFNVVKHAGVNRAAVSMSARDDGRIELQVQDSGVGFDPERHRASEGAFNSFGLFSIRERIEMVGGRMEVESSPGRGVRTTLVIPLTRADREKKKPGAAPQAAQSASAEASSKRAGKTIRVLLADDHKLIREGLAGLLRQEKDIEVVGEARDGRDAVDLARKTRPDVVLMDVSMPGLDGIEATRRIIAEMPNARVIGLSTNTDEEMVTAMREAGAVAYFAKDVPSAVLIEAIRSNAPD